MYVSTHVHGLHRCFMLLLAAVMVQNVLGDLAQTLHRLGFDPHHRQFITKLHEKGMLSFLSDKDLSAVGMSEQQISAYRNLATDLQSGNAMQKGVDKSESSARTNTGSNGKIGGAVDTDAVSDDNIEMSGRIKTLEKTKRKAAADEDYMEAARLQKEIGKLKDRMAQKQQKNPELARLQKRIEDAEKLKLEAAELEDYIEAARLKRLIVELTMQRDLLSNAGSDDGEAFNGLVADDKMQIKRSPNSSPQTSRSSSMPTWQDIRNGPRPMAVPNALPVPSTVEEELGREQPSADLTESEVREVLKRLGVSDAYLDAATNLLVKQISIEAAAAELDTMGMPKSEQHAFEVSQHWANSRSVWNAFLG